MSFIIPLLATSFFLTGPAPALGATYSLIESHAGSSFFDGWIYETGYDNTTNGDTTWSSSPSLAYVNSDNQAIIKVDNTSTVPYNEKRDSVKLLSQNWYKAGTVFIMDAVHVPVGCSVWPAWWTRGPNWPAGGEIDIFEPVNLQTTNQFALHTTEGCTATPDASLNPTGTVGTTNCDQDANYGSGCTVIGGDAGTVFNQNGGGVYIMAFETTGITIWYHRRSDIPTSLSSTASSIDTSALGTPVASYSSSSCDISKFFASQQMTLDITMCGDYAGTASVLEATCGALVGDQTCYTTYVLNSTVYNDAYFQINYLNVYGGDDSIDKELSGKVAEGVSTASSTSTSTVTGSSGSGMGTATSSARVTGTTTAASNLTNAAVGDVAGLKSIVGGLVAAVGMTAGFVVLFL